MLEWMIVLIAVGLAAWMTGRELYRYFSVGAGACRCAACGSDCVDCETKPPLAAEAAGAVGGCGCGGSSGGCCVSPNSGEGNRHDIV